MGNFILLIHPPVAKACEGPPGVAKLLGALKTFGIPAMALDLNLECQLAMIAAEQVLEDRWTRRAVKKLSSNLELIRDIKTYRKPDLYRRTVSDLNRLLQVSPWNMETRTSLSNFEHQRLMPVESSHLIEAARNPHLNPFYTYFSKRVEYLVDTVNPTVVGISLNFLSQALCSFAIIGFLRHRYPGIKIVVGGGLLTSWMKRPGFTNPFGEWIDELVAGPGEEALLALAGISRTTGEAVLPDYDFALGSPYLSPGFILPYSTATGCYWKRCSFCPERAEGNVFLPIPEAVATTQLRRLVDHTRPVLVHLLDSALRPPLLEFFANHPIGAPWYGFARITDHLADQEFCFHLKRSGCVMLKLGLESGDQSVLDNENKGIDLRVASKALTNLKKAGIATYVYLLFGTLSETAEKARNTLRFIASHSTDIGFLNLAIFNLPLSAPQVGGLRTHTHYEGDLSLYTDFEHPKGWNRTAVRQFLDREFKRHPAIAEILRRDPPFFTSNHAPFFAPLPIATSATINHNPVSHPPLIDT